MERAPHRTLKIASVGLLCALASCQLIPGTDAYYAHEARLALADRVLDIDTAKITNVKAVETADIGTVICGSINGRNEFGAYAGNMPFAVSTNTKTVALVTAGMKADDRTARLIGACYTAKVWG